jgi:L-rhamnose 1-dehydrogenase
VNRDYLHFWPRTHVHSPLLTYTPFNAPSACTIPTTMTPTPLLAGKVAAITGGLTGIGRAIALEFLRQGAFVAIGRLGGPSENPNLDSMRTEAGELMQNLIDVEGDISLPETGRRLVGVAVAKWGKLDVFVSNAGVCEFAEFLE